MKATEIITAHKDDVTLIAETLLVNETINEEEIDYLLKNRKMPDEKVSQKDAAHNDIIDEQAKKEASEAAAKTKTETEKHKNDPFSEENDDSKKE